MSDDCTVWGYRENTPKITQLRSNLRLGHEFPGTLVLTNFEKTSRLLRNIMFCNVKRSPDFQKTRLLLVSSTFSGILNFNAFSVAKSGVPQDLSQRNGRAVKRSSRRRPGFRSSVLLYRKWLPSFLCLFVRAECRFPFSYWEIFVGFPLECLGCLSRDSCNEKWIARVQYL